MRSHFHANPPKSLSYEKSDFITKEVDEEGDNEIQSGMSADSFIIAAEC